MKRLVVIFSALLFILATDPLAAKSASDPVYIGINLEPVAEGLKITTVEPGTPAETAGIKPGMILVNLDGTPIPGGAEGLPALKAVAAELVSGIAVDCVVIQSDGTQTTLKLIPTSRTAWFNKQTKKLADRIVERIAKMRGLQVKKEVLVNMYTRDGLYNRMRQEFERDTVKADIKKFDLLATRLGSQPEGVDTVELTLQMLKMGVGGFYSPDDKELVLIAGESAEGSEIVMAHELTHMIQDQHFGMKSLLASSLYNSDRSMVVRCVAEGDAKNLELNYAKTFLNQDDSSQWLSERKPGGTFIPPHLPAEQRFFLMLQKQMLSPYTLGARFVGEALRRQGWDGVNRLYLDLPRSTEQILHWEKYFDPEQRDDPVDVDLTVFTDWADDGEIDESEAKKIRRKWQLLKSDGEQFVTACERGKFMRSE